MSQRQRSIDAARAANNARAARGAMPLRLGVLALLVAFGACVPDPPTAGDTEGSIVASVSTTGPDAPSSFGVALDGDAPQTVGANASRSFTNLVPGTYSVALTSLPANCAAAGDNPRDVTVAGGAEVSVAFEVTCTQVARGSLQVTTTAAGQDIDSDGFSVSIDGGTPQSIDTNATRTFNNLPAGSHTVELSGLAGNCAVDGANPRTVNVPADQTATTTFAVVCVTTRGEIVVTVTSVGVSFDPDGYEVDLDDDRKQPVASNGSTTFTSVLEGTHTLTLGDVEGGCTIESENPLSVEVIAGQSTAASFDVECIF
jgi:hypothetical protein